MEREAFLAGIGRRISAARFAQGLSAAQLGMLMGHSQQQVSKHEAGKTPRLSIANLVRYALVLKTSAGALIGDDEASLSVHEVGAPFEHDAAGPPRRAEAPRRPAAACRPDAPDRFRKVLAAGLRRVS